MDITISITEANRLTALARAASAHNARSNAALTDQQFLQMITDQNLDAYVASLLVPRITPFDFLSRFTPDERVAIRTAAQTNIVIADYIGMLNSAPAVVLTDPLTVGGTQALEAAGLISAGRAAQILAL